MVRSLVKKIKRNFTLKFIALFAVIFVFSTVLSTYIFSRFIYRDIVNRIKLELISTKDDLIDSFNDKRKLAFHYSQFIAAAENIYLYPRSYAEDIKGLETFIIEKARLIDFDVDLIKIYPGEELKDETLKKALTGVVSSSYAMAGKLGKTFSIVAVSPVLEGGTVRKIVRVRFPVTRKFLLERKQILGSDITILSGGIVVASTSTCSECMLCFKRVIASEKHRDLLKAGGNVYFEDNCEPYYHSGIITKIEIGGDLPLYLFVTRQMKGEIVAFKKSAMAYVGGVVAYSAIMILLFVIFARRLTRPIKKLTAMAKDISEGKSGITVEQTRDDEIGELEVSLNEMSGKLAEAFQQIEERKRELEVLNAELKDANVEILGWNKNLEERVREKSKELERIHEKMVEIEKMAAVGQLTAGVAHEINNPLAGIIGYVQFGIEKLGNISLENMKEEDLETIKNYLNTVEELANRCKKIVSNLTDFSLEKLYDLDQIDINDLVNATCVFFQKELEGKGISVHVDLAKDLRRIYGSAKGLRQVLENMIINASDAMPGGGKLNVSTRNNGDNIILDIMDTGRGIPRSDMSKIFEPFFTTKDVGKGTGLGLYVSYNIIRRHGGDISVRSEEGKGSTFSIIVPSYTYRDKLGHGGKEEEEHLGG